MANQEHRQMAAVVLQFLQRTQLVGADADNYTVVRNWLTMIANGDLEVSKAPSPPAKQAEQSTAPVKPSKAK